LAGCNWNKLAKHWADDAYYQDQFFGRWATPGLYLPDPRVEQLDLDDPVIQRKYRQDPDSFTDKLHELHIDINTLWTKLDTVNVRVFGVQEGNPATA
jgi:hypothetical protein